MLPAGGDPTETEDRVAAVERMQAHIEAHLTEPITLQSLARAAGYSPWHAARLFRDLLGRPPFDYIRARRLSLAAERLRNGGERIADVAFDFVFDSHEGFTRAFARQFGLPPGEFVRTGRALRPFLPPQARNAYRMQQKGEPAMNEEKGADIVFVQAVERPARKMLLKRGRSATEYFEYCEEVGCDVWEVLTGIPDALHEPVGAWLPAGLRPEGTSEYVQGVEVPMAYAGPIPEGFELMDLPPCTLLVFQGPPFEDEKFGEAIGALWNVMERYKPEQYGYRWADEDGPRIQLEPLGYRGYIEARPVRPIR